MKNTEYIEEGYLNREDYLTQLVVDNGLDEDLVHEVAGSLGEEEDFDTLPEHIGRLANIF